LKRPGLTKLGREKKQILALKTISGEERLFELASNNAAQGYDNKY